MNNTNIEELIRLIQENPELPIVPMVEGRIVAEEGSYDRWLGEWGRAHIGEYFVGDEIVHFKSEDDWDDIETAITDISDYDTFEAMSDEEAKAAYNALPWIKAIIVNIDIPS